MATRPPAALRHVRAVLAAVTLAAAGVAAVDPSGAPVLARAAAEEEWLAEFEAVCSKTQDAMSLPEDELRSLLARCDGLRPRIEALDAPRRKVYLRRLQLCRDLYRFVLDSRGPG